MDPNIIEIRKKYSKLINESKRQAKQEKCLWCGKKITRFCNSHSVPRCVLDNIDTDGKVDYFNAIVNIPFINNDKGLFLHFITRRIQNMIRLLISLMN